MSVDKSTLRHRCRDQRLALRPEIRTQATRCICDAVSQLTEFEAAPIIALYAAADGEVDLRCVFDRARAQGKSCFFPAVHHGDMVFYPVADWSDLQPGRYDILSPKDNGAVLDPQHCALIVVPGVAFDRQGNRLGRGKGFYDRYLPTVGGLRVGVCFDCCRVEALPHEPHDVGMDVVITESGILRF